VLAALSIGEGEREDPRSVGRRRGETGAEEVATLCRGEARAFN